jgi:class 3 adenylate cyclase
MPDAEQITIGSGRRFDRLAVLFLDICAFSSRKNWTAEEQKQVMVLMNIFMAEMISIVRDFGGTFEKNTGDGLMAYFGEDGSSAVDVVRSAVEAAVVMHYVNDHLIGPWLQQQKRIDPVRFRIGIDIGPVTIAHVGIPRGNESSVVAVGTTANIACKLMNQIPDGGICIGDEVRQALPPNWATTCVKCEQNSGFVYTATLQPYAAWELNHRLSPPV